MKIKKNSDSHPFTVTPQKVKVSKKNCSALTLSSRGRAGSENFNKIVSQYCPNVPRVPAKRGEFTLACAPLNYLVLL